MLFLGRVDLVIMEEKNFAYLMDHIEDLKPYRNNYKILSPPLAVLDLYCIISRNRKDGESIRQNFNKTLDEMKSDGTYADILDLFQFNE